MQPRPDRIRVVSVGVPGDRFTRHFGRSQKGDDRLATARQPSKAACFCNAADASNALRFSASSAVGCLEDTWIPWQSTTCTPYFVCWRQDMFFAGPGARFWTPWYGPARRLDTSSRRCPCLPGPLALWCLSSVPRLSGRICGSTEIAASNGQPGLV